MIDYKEMYLTLLVATENSIRTLIEAQKDCEELYIKSCDSDPKKLTIISTDTENKKR